MNWQSSSIARARRDASKVALAWLVAALRRGGGALLDCQFMTAHLASLGAVEIDQADYLARLRAAQAGVVAGVGGTAGSGVGLGEGAALGLPAGFAALFADAPPDAFGAPGVASSPGKRIAQSLTQTS